MLLPHLAIFPALRPQLLRGVCHMTSTAAALPPLLDPQGAALTTAAVRDRLQGKRVALYFSASWCPMCTDFEPSLLSFTQEAAAAGKPIELLFVGSDRSETDQAAHATALGALQVPFDGDSRAELKKQFRVWAGAESPTFGTGRRSGVPALVVLRSCEVDEIAFLGAEAKGAAALKEWPIDEGVW